MLFKLYRITVFKLLPWLGIIYPTFDSALHLKLFHQLQSVFLLWLYSFLCVANFYRHAEHFAYHGAHVSFVQRPSSWGQYRVSYTFSKAMSNVGEFFFSSPIDAFDLEKDWGRSDSDQRHRFVVNGTATFHGFQLSGLLQSYSALPFNITSGVTTLQGTAGRPIVDGQFIPRNAGIGPDFFSLGMRLSRTFAFGSRMRFEALVEGFNLTNHTNVVTVQGNFGSGAYPANPSADFGTPTSVGEPRSFQFGARFRF